MAISISAVVHLLTVGKMTFLVHDISTRVSGIFYYANNAMMASVSILLSVVVFFLSEEKVRRLPLLLLNAILCLLVLASSDTRSAMLALVVSLFFILVLTKVRLGTKIVLISFGFIVLTSSYFFFNYGENKQLNQQKIIDRQVIWEAAINGVKQRPMIGFGNKEIFFQGDYRAKRISAGITDAHNAYLMHMLTFGIPSSILFMFFLLIIVRSGYNNYKKEYICLHSITIFWLFVSLFWGRTFLLSSNITQIIFMVSMLGIVCHPDAFRKPLPRQHYYVYSVST